MGSWRRVWECVYYASLLMNCDQWEKPCRPLWLCLQLCFVITNVKVGHYASEYYISPFTCTFLHFRPGIPISSRSCCHFLQISPPVFLSLSVSVSRFFHSAAPGSVSPFLGHFFSHILRKSSLFLLSSVDSPLWTVMKQHRGISEEEARLKTPFSSLLLIYWGIKEKNREQSPMKWTHPGLLPVCLIGRPASMSYWLLTTQTKLRVKWIIWQ